MRFWQLEVPFAMPALLWNMMMSMSGSWFFVVASEAITVGDTNIALPGIGSYIALAIEQRTLGAIGWAIADHADRDPALRPADLPAAGGLGRPLPHRPGAGRQVPASWALTHDAALAPDRRADQALFYAVDPLEQPPAPRSGDMPPSRANRRKRRRADLVWFVLLVLVVALALWRIARILIGETSLREALEVAGLACLTLLRVVVLIALASLIWVPIGIWVGLRPRATAIVQPIAQFLAAFPANLLFPLVVFGIVSWKLNPDIWLSPLMILGTQWYILFNVIAGAAAMPAELRYAAQNLGVRGWLWWRKVALPGVLPVLRDRRDHRLGRLPGTPRSWPRSPAGATRRSRRTAWAPISPRPPRPATSTASSSASRP